MLVKVDESYSFGRESVRFVEKTLKGGCVEFGKYSMSVIRYDWEGLIDLCC